MKKKILIVFSVILSFLTFTPSGIAKVYKYVDKNGIPPLYQCSHRPEIQTRLRFHKQVSEKKESETREKENPR